MKLPRDLSPLLRPRGIAVVGASERPGSAGRIVLENLLHLGYDGPVYAVHPRHPRVLGFPCYRDLETLPEPVDLVAVLVGAAQVIQTLESAAQIGAGAAWVLASGFAEAGPDGEELQARLANLAHERGLLVCGPNCIGVVNLYDRVATCSVALSRATRAGNVSAVVQSGAICLGLANAARFGFRYLISSGNEAVLDCADYIAYLAGDVQTQVIIAFLEGIRRPARFEAAVKVAADAGKPVLVVKVGRSTLARRTVQAHTGSLAGSDSVYDAVFRELGVVRLETLDELVEATELFLKSPLPQGDGVGLLSLSGGQIGLIADLAEELGLRFPSLSTQAQLELADILPPFSNLANPLDAWGSGDLESVYPACIDVVSRESSVDLLAVSRDTPPGVAEREVEQSVAVAQAAVLARQRSGKPVVLFSNLSGGFHPAAQDVLSSGSIPYLQGTREALRAIQALTDYGRFRRVPAEAREYTSPPQLSQWRRRLTESSDPFSYVEGRALLTDYRIGGPAELVVSSREEAIAAAGQLDYPVAVKLLSPDVQHKTEVDGVRLGLDCPEAVAEAFDEVIESVRLNRPNARLDGILVQAMIPAGAVEVVLGMLNDPDFGPIVLYGSGGILVELLQDSVLSRPPLSRTHALEMINETRGARLLRGFRRQPPADMDSLIDALVRFSQLAADLGQHFAAFEVNPLMVLPRGGGVSAVDFLIERKGV
jgi:acyl-CoA synthetase (NDP forming)